ncbi:MAG: Hsp70 family protein, partial [Actinobacteria bacterium]|nr:Hsp70 family protein [Actinomycetota bacterium]
MSYGLGIDVGTSFTAAAVCRGGERGSSRPEVVPLGTRAAAVASVIFLGEDGQVVVGDAAERRALTDPDRVVREFKRRLGDDIPLVVGGEPYG